MILAYANITQPSRPSGEDVSGERDGKLCGTVGTTAHKCQDTFDRLDRGTFDAFLGSFKGLMKMMSVFYKLTSSPLLLK